MMRPITPVDSSAMKNSRKSSMSRSASLPTGTNLERPTPNRRSRGATLLNSAPAVGRDRYRACKDRVAVRGVVAQRQRVAGVEDAVGVRPHDPHAAGAGDGGELGLARAALLGAELGETIGADDGDAHAHVGALAYCVDDRAGRNHQQHAVDRSGHVLDRAVAGQPLDLAAARIDRRDAAGKTAALEIADRGIALLAGRARCPDHRDMRRPEQRLQRLAQAGGFRIHESFRGRAACFRELRYNVRLSGLSRPERVSPGTRARPPCDPPTHRGRDRRRAAARHAAAGRAPCGRSASCAAATAAPS